MGHVHGVSVTLPVPFFWPASLRINSRHAVPESGSSHGMHLALAVGVLLSLARFTWRCGS